MDNMLKLVSFLVAGILAVPLIAADTTKIQVHVTNRDDKPVDRASVIVKFVEGRSAVKFGAKVYKHWETRTSQEGVAKIPEIPKGKILIQIIAKGYQTFGNVFQIEDDEKIVEIKLNPPQPQYSAHQ